MSKWKTDPVVLYVREIAREDSLLQFACALVDWDVSTAKENILKVSEVMRKLLATVSEPSDIRFIDYGMNNLKSCLENGVENPDTFNLAAKEFLSSVLEIRCLADADLEGKEDLPMYWRIVGRKFNALLCIITSLFRAAGAVIPLLKIKE